MLLDIKSNILFKYFLGDCKKLGIDISIINNIATLSKKYYRGTEITREQLRYIQILENRWYESLDKGKPDYGIYNTDDYLADMWACWEIYSRKYLRSIRSKKSLPNNISITDDLKEVKTIIDLGCGIGYTTAALTELFPYTTVMGTNIDNTPQIKIARNMGKRYDFQIVSNIKEIDTPVDLIFASEYFEHFYKPIEHLIDIIKTLTPKAFLIANAFSQKSMGHFNYYQINGDLLENQKVSRLFNSVLREYGFIKIKTNLWNNRPAYWKAH